MKARGEVKRFVKAALASAGAGVALVIMMPGMASAVTGHPISGTCYESGDTFVSSNVRVMSGSYINAGDWSSLPTYGLVFGVQNYNTGGGMGQIYAPPTGQQRITSNRAAGTEFVNYCRLQSPGHQSNYSFAGSEQY